MLDQCPDDDAPARRTLRSAVRRSWPSCQGNGRAVPSSSGRGRRCRLMNCPALTWNWRPGRRCRMPPRAWAPSPRRPSSRRSSATTRTRRRPGPPTTRTSRPSCASTRSRRATTSRSWEWSPRSRSSRTWNAGGRARNLRLCRRRHQRDGAVEADAIGATSQKVKTSLSSYAPRGTSTSLLHR